MELLFRRVHEAEEFPGKQHTHQRENCSADDSRGDSSMDCPADVLDPSRAETVCNSNACAHGKTYEKVYHEVDDSSGGADSSHGIASAAPTNDYEIGGVEQELKNSREYDRYGVEYDPAYKRTLTHIRCFSWHKKDSVLPHIMALRLRVRAQKSPRRDFLSCTSVFSDPCDLLILFPQEAYMGFRAVLDTLEVFYMLEKYDK